MDRASDCEEITVSNKELQMMCRGGDWLNDNVRTLCGYPVRTIASISFQIITAYLQMLKKDSLWLRQTKSKKYKRLYK